MKGRISVKLPEQSEFVRTINRMASEYSTYDIFNDFLTLSCYAFANASHFSEEREKKYLGIIGKYSKEVRQQFPKLLALVTKGFEKGFCDFLGEVYMACDFSNDNMGQFFTPYSVCQLCAESTIPDDLDKNRIYTVMEPACGGGAMVIALAEVLYKKGFNYQMNMYAEMTDLSWSAVCMSMIQMSLLGVPATIIHGNSITMETYDVFETPMVGINLVKERLANQKNIEKESLKKLNSFKQIEFDFKGDKYGRKREA